MASGRMFACSQDSTFLIPISLVDYVFRLSVLRASTLSAFWTWSYHTSVWDAEFSESYLDLGFSESCVSVFCFSASRCLAHMSCALFIRLH